MARGRLASGTGDRIAGRPAVPAVPATRVQVPEHRNAPARPTPEGRVPIAGAGAVAVTVPRATSFGHGSTRGAAVLTTRAVTSLRTLGTYLLCGTGPAAVLAAPEQEHLTRCRPGRHRLPRDNAHAPFRTDARPPADRERPGKDVPRPRCADNHPSHHKA
ncbi:hypothetical protein [Streptomyces sp. NPDC056796]|uniref:hypothetical protein n=1 Tax=Streptomyces sp. NPDC056796 TaxID=3345947 RepID=UPI0036AFAE11